MATTRERFTTTARSEAQAHLERTLAPVATPLVVVDLDLEVMTANPAFTALTGWPLAEMLGASFAELFGKAMHRRLAAVDDDAWSAPRAFVRHPAGGLGKPVALGASLIRAPSGHGCWLVHVTPRSLLARSDPEAPPTATAPELGETALQRLAESVRRSGAQLGACHLRVVGLQRAREIAGHRWPRLQRRVAILCETTIVRELHPDDVFTMTETGDYLVCFRCDDGADADRRAAKLNGEIERRLMGEGEILRGRGVGEEEIDARALGSIGLDVRSGAVAAADIATGSGLLDRVVSDVAVRHCTQSSVLDLYLDWLSSYRGMAFLPLRSRDGADSTLLRARLNDRRIHEMTALAAIDGRVAEVSAALDRRRLELLRTALERGIVDRRSVILNVNLASLENRRARGLVFEHLRLLGDFPRRWLIANIVGVPPATYRGRVQDAIFMLKPWSRTQALTLPPSDLATTDLGPLPCRLFVLDARTYDCSQELAGRVAGRIERARARLILEGAREPALQTALRPDLVVQG